MVLRSYFSRYRSWRMDVQMDVRTYGQSRDNQNFWDRWVTKFSKVWGSACVTSVRRSSAKIKSLYGLGRQAKNF